MVALRLFCVVLVLTALCDLPASQGTLLIDFMKVPKNPTRFRDALFVYNITNGKGAEACKSGCTITCQIDAKTLKYCSADSIWIKNVSVNQEHTFSLKVISLTGEQSSSRYSWFVDTIHPRASVGVAESFTKSAIVSANITFSEPCPGNGGFNCTSASNCDLHVSGPGVIVPSSLKQFDNSLKYSIDVALSMQVSFGRVVLSMDRVTCTDQAGNPFIKSQNSSFVLRFDRRPDVVTLWTSVPQQQLDINHVSYTIQATNKTDHLRIYLYFSQPVLNSSNEILNVLQPSMGILSLITRRSHGNRMFGFQITNVSSLAVVTVNLEANNLFSRTGTQIVPPPKIVLLYDVVRPQVHLSSTSLGKTKDQSIGVLVEFTEPVFDFDSRGIKISYGRLARFKELSKTTYILNVLPVLESVVSIFIPENVAHDISGNMNLASNELQVRHYSIPTVSITLSFLATAGVLVTSFAASALAVSSATLGAAGALTSATSNYMTADPSRNLLGLAGHLQVFALSSWLSVGLPIDYIETTRGLRWLIPHAKLPWKTQEVNSAIFDVQLVVAFPEISTVKSKRNLLSLLPSNNRDQDFNFTVPLHHSARLLEQRSRISLRYHSEESLKSFKPLTIPTSKSSFTKEREKNSHLCGSIPSCEWKFLQAMSPDSHRFTGQSYRKIKENNSSYGTTLNSSDYLRYFVNQHEKLSASVVLNSGKSYTGWEDFGMNLFWLCTVGGILFLSHLGVLFFLKWKVKSSFQGSLSLPRFELFLVILVLPSVCQASSFTIHGGSTAGIIVGVILLAFPAAFLLSVFILLAVAVFTGGLTEYKEIAYEKNAGDICSSLFSIIVGRSSIGRWFRKDGSPSSFLARFGILFEDRKGPAKLVHVASDNLNIIPKWINSGANGIGRMKAINSDDDAEEVEASRLQRFLGSARSAYIIVDLIRRTTLGILFGAYPLTDKSWSQTSLAFGFTTIQLLYILLLKPYIRRGVQMAEIISLACEAGIFGCGFGLLALGHPHDDHKVVGIVMLSLLFSTFLSQLANEWYSLLNQLMRLCPSSQPSVFRGLKLVLGGLSLPLLPRRYWTKLFPSEFPQPTSGLTPVVPFSPEGEQRTAETSGSITPSTEGIHEVPAYHLDSACKDPETLPSENPQTVVTMPGSEDPQSECSPQSVQETSQWNKARPSEGKKSASFKSEPRTSELRMLRELAKASFPEVGSVNEPEENVDVSEPTKMDIPTSADVGGKTGRLESADDLQSHFPKETHIAQANPGSDTMIDVSKTADECFRGVSQLRTV